MSDWTKAAEFVPSWYVPGKKPPAPSQPPTTSAPASTTNKKQENTNNNQKQNQQSKQNNNNTKKQQQNNFSVSSSKQQSPKSKPSTPPQGGKKNGGGSAFQQTSSWVTPPMAPAADPSSKNNSKLASSKANNNNSNAAKAALEDVPPSLDLGLSANASEFNPGKPYVVNANSERNTQVRTVLEKPKEDSIKTAIETLGVKHTDADAKRIVSESKMKVSAAAFVPAGFVPKMRASVKPVSLPSAVASAATIENVGSATAAAAAAEAEKGGRDFSLVDTWCLYFDDDIKKSAEEFDPYLICHLSDIPTFWRVFQNVPTVSRQADNTNYYLFREGVMPKWEDEKNKGGGAWTLKFQLTRSSETIDATWERLCCQIVGENWTEDVRATVNGIVAKIRPRGVTFQLWVSKRIDTLLPQLQDRALAPTLAAAVWEYIPHPKDH